MEEQQVGWIAAIIIGGVAGWLSRAVHEKPNGASDGAAVANWLFGFLAITFAGWISYLIAGFIGACILIAIARSGGLQQRT
jgi:uncharacterized membrane protein YeaQ/YmgE (transglycosylase-associated protein family)